MTGISPFSKVAGEIAIVQAVNQHFNSFLHFFADGCFPEMFQVGDDTATIADDLLRDCIIDRIIWIVYQSE